MATRIDGRGKPGQLHHTNDENPCLWGAILAL